MRPPWGRSGDLFVLDMGDPIRIIDLARDLVRLSGRDPDTQPMVVVGLRPGEKLHEELFYDAERVEPTSVAKVMRAAAQPPPTHVRDDVRELLALATGSGEDQLRTALVAYAISAGEPGRVDVAAQAAVPRRVVRIDVPDQPQPASVVG